MYLYLDADLLNKGQSIPKQTVSTSPEVVDCPLGGSCPKGGKHTLGSQTLIEHTELAAKASQAGAPPGDESKGKDPEKPGVTPASQNMGSVGADQQKTVNMDNKRTRRIKPGEIPNSGFKDEEENSSRTLREFPAVASVDSGKENPGSQKKTLIDSEINLDRHKRQDFPNPLDASNAPADSKAIDHYRLSKVAKETGDDENAKKHEKLARERSNGFSSAQHKEISEQLKAEGLQDHSDFHSKIHEKTTAANAEAINDSDEYSAKPGDVAGHSIPYSARNSPKDSKSIDHYRMAAVAREHGDTENEKEHKQLARKRADFKSNAKDQHKKLSEDLKAAGLHEDAKHHESVHKFLEEHEAKQTAKEVNKKTAEKANSLKDKKDKKATSKPDAKKPPKEDTSTDSDVYDPNDPAYDTDDEADARAAGKLPNRKVPAAKTTNKQTAEAAKKLKEESAAKAKAHSPAPASDSDHAKVLAHKAEARQLREQIQAKIDAGTMHPDDEQRAQHVLSALDVHDQLETVPSQNHQADLKTLKASSKDIAKPDKPEKEPKPQKTEKEPTPETKRGGSNGISAKQRIQTGVNAGTRLADAAVSPRGAGSAGSQVINYGGSGAVSLGHGLLTSRAEKKKAEEAEDDTDAAEVKEGK